MRVPRVWLPVAAAAAIAVHLAFPIALSHAGLSRGLPAIVFIAIAAHSGLLATLGRLFRWFRSSKPR